MNRKLGIVALSVSLLLTASCAGKRSGTSVSGTDEERLDQHAARLEELRSKANAGELQCPQWCTTRDEVCDISTDVCGISSRLPERTEVTQRCVASQEDCARFNDECGRCG